MARSLVSTASIVGDTTRATISAALKAVFAVKPAINHLAMTPVSDRVVADNRDLAAGASDVLDLSGGLVDVYGRPAAFGALVTILVGGAAGNAGELTLGGDPEGPFTGPFSTGGKLRIAPGGFVQVSAADSERWAADGALRISNPTGFPASYQLLLLGPPASYVGGMLDFSDPDNSGFVPGL